MTKVIHLCINGLYIISLHDIVCVESSLDARNALSFRGNDIYKILTCAIGSSGCSSTDKKTRRNRTAFSEEQLDTLERLYLYFS